MNNENKRKEDARVSGLAVGEANSTVNVFSLSLSLSFSFFSLTHSLLKERWREKPKRRREAVKEKLCEVLSVRGKYC